jgi:hypothetical protein
MKVLLIGVLFMALGSLSARECKEEDVKAAVEDVYSVFSKKGQTPETVKYVVDKNKGEFAKKCDGLYVFINVGVTNLVHISPKLHGKPLPTLRDKTPKDHGPAKDFFKAFMMNANNKPDGSFVKYVWTGAGTDLVCKSSYIMGAKDPKNPKKIYIIGAGYTANKYEKKGDC